MGCNPGPDVNRQCYGELELTIDDLPQARAIAATRLGRQFGQPVIAKIRSIDFKYGGRADVPLAKRELAMTYLLEQDDAESRANAMKLFEWFANRPDVERNDQVFGIAGEAIVNSLDHKPTESVKKLQELEKVAGRLESEQVQRMLGQRMSASLDGVIRRNQQAIGKETADKWEKLLESLSEDAN